MKVVTIDGPAGAGKSTVSRELAEAMGFAYLDTGALYRAVGLAAQRGGIDPDTGEDLGAWLAGLDLVIRTRGSRFEITLDGQPVEPAIRAEDIGELASRLSARPDVRAGLLELQRRAAEAGDLVAEGRDMGTVVFPGAQVKVFLTASDTERALRRRLQLEAQGQHVDFNEILDDMRRRDKRDSMRAASPLAPADDAHVVDTSELSQTEVVEHLLSIVRQHGYIE